MSTPRGLLVLSAFLASVRSANHCHTSSAAGLACVRAFDADHASIRREAGRNERRVSDFAGDGRCLIVPPGRAGSWKETSLKSATPSLRGVCQSPLPGKLEGTNAKSATPAGDDITVVAAGVAEDHCQVGGPAALNLASLPSFLHEELRQRILGRTAACNRLLNEELPQRILGHTAHVIDVVAKISSPSSRLYSCMLSTP